MRKKTKLALVALIIFGSSCIPTVTANNITDLGTVKYMNSLQVDIPSSQEVNLSFISSLLDENDVTITSYGFDPVLNKTRFLFTSELIIPDWWMNATHVVYIYQDTATKQLYSIEINYTSLIIPDNPWKVKYLNKSELYYLTVQELNETCDNLTLTIQHLNDLIILYTEL